jgi:membrane associated rhomboid family serine protease
MIPFDESLIKANMKSLETTESFFSDTSSSSKQLESPSKSKQRQQRYCRHWLFSSDYWGPFSKGEHWPLFTYIMMAFAIIVFSAELLMSKQSSGEFFELEPFNYMLGPSIEIMVQVGARFPPCMRRIESMPPDEHYVCLNTIAEKSKTPIMSNQTRSLGGGQSLLLLDPVADLADPRLMNSSCSLSSICGIVEFHESHVPDQTFRFLTPLFIHTGLIHLGINLSVLILLGAKVERIMNPLRFSSEFFFYSA